MIKKIILTLVVLFGAFGAIVAIQPAEFHVERSATIAAPQPAVFAHVNDFHAWEAWSPWAKLDPAVKVTFEGTPAGEGAVFRWSGNDDVGEGRMTLTESHASDLIRIKLDFARPFEATNYVEFTFEPKDDATAVTWTMSGHNNFIGKAMCLFVNMDKMLGGDFEKGLASLKTVAEVGPGAR